MLEQDDPGREYYPEPSKSVLIVHPDNLEARELCCLHHGFKVCPGARYLDGYTGDEKSKHKWMKEHMERGERKISTISEITGKYLQEIYAVVVHTIQSEWIFLQRVTKNTGETFAVVEIMIRRTSLTRLLFEGKKTSHPS